MSSVHEAVEQAISFLTTPLSKTTVSSHAISVLRSHLTASLLTLCARSGPVGISLRLAAASPPPECIGRACEASGVNWSEWLFLIGGGMGLDLDVNVTPTAVTASFCRAGTPSLGLVTVWQKVRESPIILLFIFILFWDSFISLQKGGTSKASIHTRIALCRRRCRGIVQ